MDRSTVPTALEGVATAIGTFFGRLEREVRESPEKLQEYVRKGQELFERGVVMVVPPGKLVYIDRTGIRTLQDRVIFLAFREHMGYEPKTLEEAKAHAAGMQMCLHCLAWARNHVHESEPHLVFEPIAAAKK